MGLLDKLLGNSKKVHPGAVMEAPPCPHTALVPRWDAAADMGIADRASHFVCEGCQQTFSPGEARSLQETASQRLPEPVEEKTIDEMKAAG